MKVTAGQRNIWRTQYPQPANEVLIAEGGAYGIESPDGQTFYFTHRDEDEGIWSMALPHGTPTRVVDRLYRRNLFDVGKSGLLYEASTGGCAALLWQCRAR